MGYHLLWFACKIASCDPMMVNEAITFEQNQASFEILERSGVKIQGMPSLKLSSPQQSSEELLRQINIEELRKAIGASIPNGWTVIGDSDQETTWESHGAAVQISWYKRYAIGTAYGKFSYGVEALHKALAERGLTCFDPQVGKTVP